MKVLIVGQQNCIWPKYCDLAAT